MEAERKGVPLRRRGDSSGRSKPYPSLPRLPRTCRCPSPIRLGGQGTFRRGWLGNAKRTRPGAVKGSRAPHSKVK
jgi:hypothetical protein